ncbi:amidase [Chryseolinea sp. H1M3-3]|uniref:amidase n=1 Tax=Chryseolinea sp. H1M3-3 TaxID=3034144 RepID=UPI0023EC08E8|nr:amidase [Chryseolinea sp. H1M3-3]
MNRRHFIRQTTFVSLTGSGALAYLASCTKSKQPKSANPAVPESETFALQEITISDLQQKMTSGELTARSIVEMYLKRIEQIDRNGPNLNSIIELNPDALAIADTLDEERKNGKARGPLHGIPVLIKDNIDTGDKMMTTAGSLALEGHRASKDAFIIGELRNAGAIILGKTNLSEWANFRSTRSSSGWSSRGGQTKNPYILDRSPCGSSSGSGTAVAANLCAIAIGTETDGSINCPASINGIVGIKPTVGLWSRTGIIPISKTQDTAGPMTRTVSDAAILLGALTATDTEDKTTNERQGTIWRDYAQFLKADGLKGKKIGIEKSFLKKHEAVDALLKNFIEVIKGQGAIIIEIELIDKLKDLEGMEFEILKYEFKDGLNKYLAKANASVKTLEELIKFNITNEASVMPFFKQEIFDATQAMGDLSSKDYISIHEKLLSTTRKAIDGTLNEHGLTAICGPANGPSWCIDVVNGDSFTGYGMYSPAAVAGYPSITVPMGLALGLPIGITFFGTAFSEPELLAAAYAYEQASKKRTPPSFRTTV